MTKCRHILYACIAGLGCNFVCQSAFGYTLDWTANCLNQYTEFTHDADGNMTQCGDWTYTYDAANRLKTASSNGVLIVTNFYDAKSRRVKKVTQDATMTFFYDGWNLVEERIAYTNGTTTTICYFWGKDLSGTLQGAGGVGGLLYLTIDGVPYVPDYDNIGNITRYLDANGNVVAQYTYDAFGGTLSQIGTMCDVFRHRFSTKYYDAETRLCYYLMRYYLPLIHRWLNRDPIEEDGGINLYGFCRNSPLFFFDDFGGEFRFAGDPNDHGGKYIPLWGPNSGSFSVKWEYEGSDCCGEEKESETYGPIFFNAISDYYPVWNTETIDEGVPIPYRTPAFGVNGTSGATQGFVYGDKGKLTITITWTSSNPPPETRFNPTGVTDYTQHGATWNMPNHFPWTKQPFSPFGKNGNAGGTGVRTIVVTASWNTCSKEGSDRGTVISGINESGAAVGVGPFRNKNGFREK